MITTNSSGVVMMLGPPEVQTKTAVSRLWSSRFPQSHSGNPQRGGNETVIGMVMSGLSLVLLGVGAMNSPRYKPAGLLASWDGNRVALDGGGAADPGEHLDAWLVSDERAELMPAIRRRARELGLSPAVAEYSAGEVSVRPLEVRHTSHPAYGYLLTTACSRVAWIPEFWELPGWARQVDLAFADAAGWNRPIRFAGSAGGHASVFQVAEAAQRSGIRRLVFAHIGRPSLRAIDRGASPPFGEVGRDGATYRVP
jgi:hypothetical protein